MKKTSKKVKKPKKKKISDRVATGIPQLDKELNGGLKKNSINLIAGSAGTGKSILAMQFILEGIKKHGESGVFITFEEKKEKMYADMATFGWDVQKYEDEEKFVFLEYSPEQVKSIISEGGGLIEPVIEKINAKRIVIDSITSFALLYEDELTKKEAALALFELMGKWDLTAMFTSQEAALNGGTISAALEFEVDGIIILYHVKSKGIRTRALEVLKMRGTKIPEKTVELTIGKNGISINPKKVIVF